MIKSVTKKKSLYTVMTSIKDNDLQQAKIPLLKLLFNCYVSQIGLQCLENTGKLHYVRLARNATG